MPKGQHLSHHQRKIVDRYYQNLDTITLTKLSEAVSDLAMSPTEKAAARLWKSVETALARSGADQARIEAILKSRDVKALASLVNDLATGKAPASSKGAR